MRVALFLLGSKGLAVLRALHERTGVSVGTCVLGIDAGVDDDCHDRMVSYCQGQGITYAMRGEGDAVRLNVDYVVAIGWRWLIKDVPQNRLLIFHDALLPRYRGFAPLVNAMLNHEPEVGATALLGAMEYDRGNILMQRRMSINYPAYIGDVIDGMASLYGELAVELFEGLASGAISGKGTPQDEGDATYSLWRDERDYRIDWSRSSDEIAHFIRCVGAPYRGASAVLRDAIVRIHDAHPIPDVRIEGRTSGKVIFMHSDGPVVVCGQGLLKLVDVRDEGGVSLLPLASFRSRFE